MYEINTKMAKKNSFIKDAFGRTAGRMKKYWEGL